MRKLKLQVQMSVDGFIAGAKGEMNWMVFNWDDKLGKYVNEITQPVDLIVLGKNLANNFIDVWASRAKEPGADWFTHKMVSTKKVVFSKTLKKVHWENTDLAGGDLTEEITKLKKQTGGDIIAYGGATFVSTLINADLIDEYHLFYNPAALGKGMTIFNRLDKNLKLTLKKSIAFECGIVVNHYEPMRQ